MAFRLLHIAVSDEDADVLCEKISALDPQNMWRGPRNSDDQAGQVFVVVHTTQQQEMMDTISEAMEGRDDWRLVVHHLEAILPEIDDEERLREQEEQNTVAAREEIFTQVRQDARVTNDYLVLTALATVVAAIGLNSDQVAVVIGAMVIAPLLGPILAFAFGTALGNRNLLWDSGKSFAVGMLVSVAVGGTLGMLIPVNLDSTLLTFDQSLGIYTLALPVASGAAAGLMVARGRVSALVGVMVAAALLPPVSAFGLLLGGGEHWQAARALATVAINVVAITLAAQVVFLTKGVRPRRYLDERHKNSVRTNIGVLAGLLLVAAGVIWWV